MKFRWLNPWKRPREFNLRKFVLRIPRTNNGKLFVLRKFPRPLDVKISDRPLLTTVDTPSRYLGKKHCRPKVILSFKHRSFDKTRLFHRDNHRSSLWDSSILILNKKINLLTRNQPNKDEQLTVTCEHAKERTRMSTEECWVSPWKKQSSERLGETIMRTESPKLCRNSLWSWPGYLFSNGNVYISR